MRQLGRLCMRERNIPFNTNPSLPKQAKLSKLISVVHEMFDQYALGPQAMNKLYPIKLFQPNYNTCPAADMPRNSLNSCVLMFSCHFFFPPYSSKRKGPYNVVFISICFGTLVYEITKLHVKLLRLQRDQPSKTVDD